MSAVIRRAAQLTDLLERLRAIVGAAHVVCGAAEMAPYLAEPRRLWRGVARCVVRPGSTSEVAAVVAECARAGIGIVPQGGNTGLVGGQVPDSSGAQIVLSVTRLNRILAVDTATNSMTVEAGVTLQQVHAAAEAADRLFPLSLASEGSCTIGGNLATNAGGSAVLAYGMARDLVLGLEVVLADGRVLNGLSRLRKDNTGYDLKHLFIGAEGTLGVITAAVLKLFVRPRAVETAFVGLESPRQCLALLQLAQSWAGQDLKTFEFMPRLGLELVAAHEAVGRAPLDGRHAWYVLLELASQAEQGLGATMTGLLEAAAAAGVIADAAVAASSAQRLAFWAWRERLPDAQTREGGSIKHDVSVPVALVPDFLEDAAAIVAETLPGARPVPFGHLGDGNIHFNVSQPVGAEAARFQAEWGALNDRIHTLVGEYGGSISAEHGIGVLKREMLAAVKDQVALDVMRALKATLDPQGIMNPGKVL